VKKESTKSKRVKLPVSRVFRANIKTCLEQNRARNVLQIPLPTPVGFPLVTFVAVVPKQKQAVPNVPVATRVNLVRATVARVNNAPRVNRGYPMMQRLLLARRASLASIKTIWAKLPVYRVFRANIKTCLEQNRAKNVFQIPLPTPVGFPLVTFVAVVPKQKQAVPNVPVATRVNLVRATVARVNNAPRVNRVHPTMQRPILVRRASLASTKNKKGKPLVTSAF
jgi:hypothetical protein